ncbi:uncharacterized protein LOC116208738 isoform X1 [Punica granatum]|uniref:Uncharacterized protein LOC116208738 isoform X1 n=1 Tax=Punica granatum TaxID=22663 RepID=A0A6P8DY79_PUNGR|nr:uncharacterized protein LOC116208738 isoform X1 [Punica granatum]
MDKARDVRRRHFNKRSPNFSSPELSEGDVLASEKTRKERFQKLSLVGRASSSFPDGQKSMEPVEASDREEEPRAVVGRKRFKLPRMFLEDRNLVEQASVPRKLRSAMKKRSRESLSPPIPNSKKQKHSMSARGSPKKDGAKKTKKQGKSGSGFTGPITKDEEEVVETLYALAGMFLNDRDSCCCSRRDDESSPADTPTVPGGTEPSTNSASGAKEEELKPSVASYNEERSSEETARTCPPDGLVTHQQPELLDCKLSSKDTDTRAEIDLQTTTSQSRSEKSNEVLHASGNFGLAAELGLDAHLKKPEEMDRSLPSTKQEDKEVTVAVIGNQLGLHHKSEDSQNNGPVLWPGLLSGSLSQDVRSPSELPTSKIPAWLHGAACSKKPQPIESGNPVDKVPKSKFYKISRKKCVRHVFISHLIHSLQMPESNENRPLQPDPGRRHEQTEQRVNAVGSNFNVLKNGLSQAFASTLVSDSQRYKYETRNAIIQQNRHNQGPKSSSSGNEGFDFLSLSTSVSGLNQKTNVPYFHSINQQQHMSLPLSTSKTYYSPSYSDQLSGVTTSRQVQLQLPSYLANSGRSLIYRGPVVLSKELQNQQMLWTSPIASTQSKPTGNLKAVAQFPTWQNGSVESPATVPFTAIIPPPPLSSIEVLGPKHSQLLSQQYHHQQQLLSLRSPYPPTICQKTRQPSPFRS